MPDDKLIRDTASQVIAQIIGRTPRQGETFISSGLIDSLSILKLITHLEKRLKLRMPTENLQPDDFDTLDLIVETVQRVGLPANPDLQH